MKQEISIFRSDTVSPKSNTPCRPGMVIVLFLRSGIRYSFVILVASPIDWEVVPLNENPMLHQSFRPASGSQQSIELLRNLPDIVVASDTHFLDIDERLVA